MMQTKSKSRTFEKLRFFFPRAQVIEEALRKDRFSAFSRKSEKIRANFVKISENHAEF